MNDPIPMALPDIDETDVKAVAEVVRSGRLALGPKAAEFERMIADYVGVKHAVAVSSGTAALHLIVKALGIEQGDEVLVPSFTFAASVNAILYEGATPVFVDIEPETYNLDPVDLEEKITPRTKAIMAVDIFGHPADWDAITFIAAKHNLSVIDDSCEALGAEYKGKKLGQFGDAAAFAFYPNKQITTGEGGVVVTNQDDIANLCRSLCNQGRGRMGAWLEHERVGYNYRIDEMSAALGATQLKRIEDLLAKREFVAQLYSTLLADFEQVRTPIVKPEVKMSWFVYVVALVEGVKRDRVIEGMNSLNIPVRAYFPPIHRQSYIREILDQKTDRLKTTELIAKRTVALPFYGRMNERQVKRVVDGLREVIESEC